MYPKITKSDGRSYLQLIEGHRDAAGKVRHRVVANLGRIDELTPQKLDPLINGPNRALGRAENTASEVVSESAQAYGDVFALHELWKDLGFDSALRKALRSGRRKTEAESLMRAMVFYRNRSIATAVLSLARAMMSGSAMKSSRKPCHASGERLPRGAILSVRRCHHRPGR